MNLKLKVWRQKDRNASGQLVDIPANNIPAEASFLEMLDIVNDELTRKGDEPIAFADAAFFLADCQAALERVRRRRLTIGRSERNRMPARRQRAPRHGHFGRIEVQRRNRNDDARHLPQPFRRRSSQLITNASSVMRLSDHE